MLQIRIQSTPNPNARKYVMNEELKAEGKVTYTDREDCKHVPLAYALLSLAGARQIHLFENVLTLTQDGNTDWGRIDQEVQHILDSSLAEHDIFFQDSSGVKEVKQLSPELKEIDGILERTIRPALQSDGGDLELLELHNNILTVKYLGACGGCPSSMTGTLEAIRSILQSEYSEDIEVVAI